MENKYQKSYSIGYFGTDASLRLTPASLAVYFQDLAISHSDSLGYTMDWFKNEQKGWVILNYHIKLHRMPCKDETIYITTWAAECGKMQAQRVFMVKDKDGNVLSEAWSRWVLMDLRKRRPVKIATEMAQAYTCSDAPSMGEFSYLIAPKDPTCAQYNRTFCVTRRDTDSNGHANNTKYFEWAADDVPDEIYLKYHPVDIKMAFQKECQKGQSILSYCTIEHCSDGSLFITSQFVDSYDETVVFARTVSHWIKQS